MPDRIDIGRTASMLHEELAFLYVKSQDLAGKSPEDIFEMFYQARAQIMAASGKKVSTNAPRVV